MGSSLSPGPPVVVSPESLWQDIRGRGPCHSLVQSSPPMSVLQHRLRPRFIWG